MITNEDDPNEISDWLSDYSSTTLRDSKNSFVDRLDRREKVSQDRTDSQSVLDELLRELDVDFINTEELGNKNKSIVNTNTIKDQFNFEEWGRSDRGSYELWSTPNPIKDLETLLKDTDINPVDLLTDVGLGSMDKQFTVDVKDNKIESSKSVEVETINTNSSRISSIGNKRVWIPKDNNVEVQSKVNDFSSSSSSSSSSSRSQDKNFDKSEMNQREPSMEDYPNFESYITAVLEYEQNNSIRSSNMLVSGNNSNNGDDDDDDDNDLMDEFYEPSSNKKDDFSKDDVSISLNKLTVKELKEKLRLAGLPVGGVKSELINRLIKS
jgi:hypothetical protein